MFSFSTDYSARLHLDQSDAKVGAIQWFSDLPDQQKQEKDIGGFIISSLGIWFRPQHGTLLVFDASILVHGTASPPTGSACRVYGSATFSHKSVLNYERQMLQELDNDRKRVRTAVMAAGMGNQTQAAMRAALGLVQLRSNFPADGVQVVPLTRGPRAGGQKRKAESVQCTLAAVRPKRPGVSQEAAAAKPGGGRGDTSKQHQRPSPSGRDEMKITSQAPSRSRRPRKGGDNLTVAIGCEECLFCGLCGLNTNDCPNRLPFMDGVEGFPGITQLRHHLRVKGLF